MKLVELSINNHIVDQFTNAIRSITKCNIAQVSPMSVSNVSRSLQSRVSTTHRSYSQLTTSFNIKIPVSVVIFALPFSLPPSRNSDPGSHGRLFSPLPTTVRSAKILQPFLPLLTRVELCWPTLLNNRPTFSSRQYSFFMLIFYFKKARRSRGYSTLLNTIGNSVIIIDKFSPFASSIARAVGVVTPAKTGSRLPSEYPLPGIRYPIEMLRSWIWVSYGNSCMLVRELVYLLVFGSVIFVLSVL